MLRLVMAGIGWSFHIVGLLLAAVFMAFFLWGCSTTPTAAPTSTTTAAAPNPTAPPDVETVYGRLFDCIQDNISYRQLFDQGDLDGLENDAIAVMRILDLNGRWEEPAYEGLTVGEIARHELELCEKTAQ